MGRGRAAGALIAVLISGALNDVARGGDLVECEPQRVTGDGRYRAYRIVDGRECWYPGQPGKPKNELFWGRGTTARQTVNQLEPKSETEPSEPPSRLVAAPPEKPETIEATPEEWRATAADQLLAFTCCWPELERPQLTSELPAWPLALLPLGLYALWWIPRPRRMLPVCAKHAGRVAAAQPHPPAPPMHTDLHESATSLFVLPINEKQHVSLASLLDRYWVKLPAQ